MTAHSGSGKPALDEIADDEDPRVQQVYRRLRRLSMIGGLTMGIGFLALMSVIAYRVVKSNPSPDVAAHATLTLPAGARVVSTAASDGRIVVTVETEGRVSLHLFDAASLRETGRLDVAPSAPLR